MITQTVVRYTKEPFVLDRTLEPAQQEAGFKPRGLWVTLDVELSWKDWCESEGFRLEALAHRAELEVLLERMLVITTESALRQFSREFGMRYEWRSIRSVLRSTSDRLDVIDWSAVSRRYGGILISPYQWNCRLDSETSWYYGWDCASGCIWDLSIIQEVRP